MPSLRTCDQGDPGPDFLRAGGVGVQPFDVEMVVLRHDTKNGCVGAHGSGFWARSTIREKVSRIDEKQCLERLMLFGEFVGGGRRAVGSCGEPDDSERSFWRLGAHECDGSLQIIDRKAPPGRILIARESVLEHGGIETLIVDPLGHLVTFEVNRKRMIAATRNHNDPGGIGAMLVEGESRAVDVADENNAVGLRRADFVASEIPTRDRLVIIEVDDVGGFHALAQYS